MQLIELQYLPPVYSIITLLQESNIVFPLYMPFRKMSFQNRAVIPAANGPITLSIPLVGGRENKDLLKDVRIDNSQRWQDRHWRTISSAYRRSPWFEFYEGSFAPFYVKHYDKLADWNLDLMAWILDSLKVKIEITTWKDCPGSSPTQVKAVRPSNFQEAEFIHGLPVYAQVFQDRIGFLPNMSIIDLIFNEGNNSRSLMAKAFI